MFGTLFGLVMFAVSAAIGLAGFVGARGYVKRRLRFVDAVQSPIAPIIAGAGAFLLTSPIAILPFLGLGLPVLFGLAVGLGTARGARDIRTGESSTRYLP
jgi:hypothetical protein